MIRPATDSHSRAVPAASRLLAVLAGAGLLAACVTVATPEPPPADPVRGGRIVEQWCRDCHLKPGQKPRPGSGPTFEEIARREGRDTRYLDRTVHEDHFPMTTYRLFEDEKRDVVAYILSLKPATP
jgi:mono/diheme cytochrome c family protein